MSATTLYVRAPGHPERRLSLQEGVAHIGRGESNEVVLADVGVSRRHARLELSAGGVVVEDLGSGNGTWFRGKRVQRQVLGHGDEVLIDPFTLRVELPAPPPDVTDGRDATVPLKAPPPGAVLTVTSAHKMPQRDFPLPTAGVFSIGRSDRNDIVLPEAASSRVHAEIHASDAGWTLRDNGSSNGTYVNARRVSERMLEDGDRIRIGTVELRFVVLPAESEGTEAYAGSLISSPGPVPPPPPSLPWQAHSNGGLEPTGGQSFPPATERAAPAPAPVLPPPPPPTAVAPRAPVPAAPTRPRPAAGPVEIEVDPSRARGKRVRKVSTGGGGFFSRPINQISLGLLVITGVMVGGKVAADTLSAFIRPNGGVAAAPAPAATPAPAASVSTLPAPPATAAPAGVPAASAAVAPADPVAVAPATPVAGAPVAAVAPSTGIASPSAVAPAVAPAPGTHTPESLMAEGMTQFSQGRYFDAAGSFYRVLQLDPNHADARRMGFVACEFITFSEVRSSLVARTTTDTARAEAKAAALALVAKGPATTVEATEAVAAALVLSPSDAELLAAQKALAGRQAASVRAAVAGKAAAQSRSLDELLAKGNAELERGANAAAVRTFESLMAADATRSSAQFYQAEDGARTARDRMKADSKQAWAEANSAMKSGDWLTARSKLGEVVKLDPYNDTAAAKLVEARKQLKEQASELYKEARVLEEIGQPEKAVALYHKVQRYVGDESDPLHGKAQTRMDALLR